MFISNFNTYEVGALIFHAFFRPQDVITNPVLYQTPFVQVIDNKILFRIWIKIRWWTRKRMNCERYLHPKHKPHTISTCISGAELKRRLLLRREDHSITCLGCVNFAFSAFRRLEGFGKLISVHIETAKYWQYKLLRYKLCRIET